MQLQADGHQCTARQAGPKVTKHTALPRCLFNCRCSSACLRGGPALRLQGHRHQCSARQAGPNVTKHCAAPLPVHLPSAPSAPAYEDAPLCSYKITSQSALLVCMLCCPQHPLPRLRGGSSLLLQVDRHQYTALANHNKSRTLLLVCLLFCLQRRLPPPTRRPLPAATS